MFFSANAKMLPMVMQRGLSHTTGMGLSSSMLGSMGYGPDSLGMSRKLPSIESSCCRINVQRQRKHENTSLPRTTLDVKMATMSLDKFPCDREPQPHP
jgi:hypothetical protein